MKQVFALQKGGVLPSPAILGLVGLLLVLVPSLPVASRSNEVCVTAQTGSAEERIRRVENGLLPPAILKGEQPPLMKLEDRMRFYRTPELSIVIINNGRGQRAFRPSCRKICAEEAGNESQLLCATALS